MENDFEQEMALSRKFSQDAAGLVGHVESHGNMDPAILQTWATQAAALASLSVAAAARASALWEPQPKIGIIQKLPTIPVPPEVREEIERSRAADEEKRGVSDLSKGKPEPATGPVTLQTGWGYLGGLSHAHYFPGAQIKHDHVGGDEGLHEHLSTGVARFFERYQ